MHDPVWCWLADRTRRRRPQLSRGIVTQKHAVARWIADGVVVPRSDAIEEAVPRPRDATTTFADKESTRRIPHDVDPRRRWIVASRQVNLILTRIVEPAQ